MILRYVTLFCALLTSTVALCASDNMPLLGVWMTDSVHSVTITPYFDGAYKINIQTTIKDPEYHYNECIGEGVYKAPNLVVKALNCRNYKYVTGQREQFNPESITSYPNDVITFQQKDKSLIMSIKNCTDPDKSKCERIFAERDELLSQQAIMGAENDLGIDSEEDEDEQE